LTDPKPLSTLETLTAHGKPIGPKLVAWGLRIIDVEKILGLISEGDMAESLAEMERLYDLYPAQAILTKTSQGLIEIARNHFEDDNAVMGQRLASIAAHFNRNRRINGANELAHLQCVVAEVLCPDVQQNVAEGVAAPTVAANTEVWKEFLVKLAKWVSIGIYPKETLREAKALRDVQLFELTNRITYQSPQPASEELRSTFEESIETFDLEWKHGRKANNNNVTSASSGTAPKRKRKPTRRRRG